MHKGIKQVALIAFNGTTEMSIAPSRDMFSAANMSVGKSALQDDDTGGDTQGSIKVVTHDGQDVRSFSGAMIKADAAIDVDDDYDLIIISGFWGNVRTILKENAELLNWLIDQYKKGTVIACLHAGTYFLAEAGLLDGKVATVYWRMVDDFKTRYKQVILMPEKSITAAGSLYCSSGVASAIEMANFLIEKLWGIDVAQKVARNFLMDVPRKNTQFNLAMDDAKKHKDDKVLAAQSWIETHFSSDFLMEELADRVGLSLRNMTRRFKKSTGDTPSHYLQKVRIEIAKDLLATTEMSVDQITYRVGYVDVSSFCKLFKKVTSKTPSEFRLDRTA